MWISSVHKGRKEWALRVHLSIVGVWEAKNVHCACEWPTSGRLSMTGESLNRKSPNRRIVMQTFFFCYLQKSCLREKIARKLYLCSRNWLLVHKHTLQVYLMKNINWFSRSYEEYPYIYFKFWLHTRQWIETQMRCHRWHSRRKLKQMTAH